MTAFSLRLVAMVTMLVDHAGLVLWPDVLLFRAVGRVSFPIFAWLIANGYRHTTSVKGYLGRLAVLAGVSQLPYYLVKNSVAPGFWGLNVFVTLGLGLLAIWMYDGAADKKIRVAVVLTLAIVAEILRADYGAMGVLSVVSFHWFWRDAKKLIISLGVIFAFPYLAAMTAVVMRYQVTAGPAALIQPVALLALPIIFSYTGQEGRKMKWVFYAFYPVHLTVLYLIVNFFQSPGPR